jgi:hypothetical protein
LAARGFGARGASEVEEAGVRSLQAQLKGVGIEVVPVFSPSSRELVRSRRIVDQKARMRLLNSVDALLARDVPFIPLYQQPWFVSHSAEVARRREQPLGRVHLDLRTLVARAVGVETR